MTESRPTRPTHECGADLAAYALGALDDDEAETFRRHLETCTICRDELASFQQVVDVLPMSAPQHRAPKGLRQRVLAEVNREAARSQATSRRSPWRLFPWSINPRPAMALGVLLVAAVITVGGLELGSSGPSTRVFHAQVTGSSGSAEVRVTGGHAELVLRHFQPPPTGEIYEVWLARARGRPQPTSALFSVTSSGAGDVDVPGSLRGIVRIMVTPEPAGGTTVPTHPAVLTAQLT